MATPPEIGGSSLGGDKYTASCCRDREEEPNEEEDPWKRIQAETINKSLASPGTVSIFRMLPQTDNQCSNVDMKHGKGFSCAIYDIHVKNQYVRDFTIGHWGEYKRNGGHDKALANKIKISYLKKREKAGDTLSKKENKQLNFGKKSNASPLATFFSEKRKNGGGVTNTPSVAGVANGLNAKTALVNSPPPK